LRLGGTTIGIQKPKYRSELGIVLDILELLSSGGQSGVIVSVISRIANVSHNSVNERYQKLVSAGLVRSVKDKKNHKYIITEDGRVSCQDAPIYQPDKGNEHQILEKSMKRYVL
jgi:predicted transcriptional regulator